MDKWSVRIRFVDPLWKELRQHRIVMIIARQRKTKSFTEKLKGRFDQGKFLCVGLDPSKMGRSTSMRFAVMNGLSITNSL